MDAESASAGAPPREPAPAQPRRLVPAGEPLGAQEFVDSLALRSSPPRDGSRPRVLLNMASTADGRTTIAGRSGPIGNRADHELFHALRAECDAVLTGAGTARTERYGPIIRDPGTRRRRVE